MSETFKAEIISGGRITIPEVVRKILSLEDGDIAEFTIKKATK